MNRFLLEKYKAKDNILGNIFKITYVLKKSEKPQRAYITYGDGIDFIATFWDLPADASLEAGAIYEVNPKKVNINRKNYRKGDEWIKPETPSMSINGEVKMVKNAVDALAEEEEVLRKAQEPKEEKEASQITVSDTPLDEKFGEEWINED